ncbi:MAG: DEAD/DEAH box helicase [Candidatus Aenigmatarchaeota archaeon]
MKFSEMNLSEGTLRALKEMNLEDAFPIQEMAIKPIMEGKDVMGKAESGSGKTLAFSIPIVEKIKYPKNIQVLILTPTRELAEQVCSELAKVGKYTMAKCIPVYGGKSIEMQARAFANVNVVVATPGRLMDHMGRNNIDLRHVHTLVLDEADRMLDMGFIDDIKYILRYIPTERQTLLFSATFPEEIKRMVSNFMKDPVLFELNKEKPTVDLIKQAAVLVRESDKRQCLEYILEHEKPALTLIFVSTKIKSNRLHRDLSRIYNIGIIHGGLSQNQRERVMNDFKHKKIKYLIATDVAARGIDVKDVTHVINYDMPNDVETYVHRIGRTGRAGASGDAITLFTQDDISEILRYEYFIKVKIPKQKFENGSMGEVNPEEFSEKNVIIKKWGKREGSRGGGGFRRGGFSRGGGGFNRRSSGGGFGRGGGGFSHGPAGGFRSSGGSGHRSSGGSRSEGGGSGSRSSSGGGFHRSEGSGSSFRGSSQGRRRPRRY